MKMQSHSIDWLMVGLWAALITVGLVMVASASINFSAANYQDPWYFVKRHLIYLGLALSGAVIVFHCPISFWEKHGSLLFIGALILLLIVLVPGIGKKVNGSQRWLVFGPITVQASEVAKFMTVIFFAGYFSRRYKELAQGWRGFIKPVLVMVLISILLLLEPDFGSTVVIAGTVVAMMFFAGVRMSQFLLLVAGAVGMLALMAVLSPYRMQRLITYLDPWADQFNSGYQLTQSLIAFGRGEWFGVGLGNSIQKLFFLPEAHTDFIFSIIAEENGLVGAFCVIALFVALISRLLSYVKDLAETQRFSAYAIFGFAFIFAAQTFINVGVASGLLPTKGLTLPLISYGGSSLIVSCAMLAFVLRAKSEADQHASKSLSTKVASPQPKLQEAVT
jgi:cell division protein FtsW